MDNTLFKIRFIMPFIFACLVFQACKTDTINKSLVIVFDQGNASYNFAASVMKEGIESAGFRVGLSDIKNLSEIPGENRIILTSRTSPECIAFLKNYGIPDLPPASAESYSIRRLSHSGNTDWYIIGSDNTGIMYGGIDAGEMIRLNGTAGLTDLDRKPYIASRGIKFNIPLDSRTPTYTSNSDAAQNNIEVMWDAGFWHKFIDNMARDHLNMLSIWSLAPFPSLVKVPEYPMASINDVKKTTMPLATFKSLNGDNISNPELLKNLLTVKTITIDEKIKFWQDVMQYASDRGVSFYLFTWNIFPYGTEESGYNLTDRVSDTKTKDYFRKATKALITTYPHLKGIGITAGENMIGSTSDDDKEVFLYDAYGQGINDALELDTSRTFQLIHRAHQTDIKAIKRIFSGLNPRCSLEYSYKYSQAHVYSSTKPDYIVKDKFLERTEGSRFFLTVRDDDWYYLRGGSDPSFTRTYLENMPKENLNGFYLGPDGYIWGREFISTNKDLSQQLVYDKRWYSFRIWGLLAYDPSIPDSYFESILEKRFPDAKAQDLFSAWAKASHVVPVVNRFHNSGCQLDFQWYPEACFSNSGFHTIDRFINTDPQNGEGLMSIREYTDAFLNKREMTGTTPVEVAAELQTLGEEALKLTRGMTSTDPELLQTVEDIKAMALLGQYYGSKILGATFKNLSDNASAPGEKQKYRDEAVRNLKEASRLWADYAGVVSKSYKPQYLNRMQQVVDVVAIQEAVDRDISLASNDNSPKSR